MSRAVTLTNLITRVRQRADIENAVARFPDLEVTQNVNDAIAEVYDLIRPSFGQDYYRSTYTFTTVANVATYALPADFLSLISVDVPLGPNLIITARPYMESERNRYKYYPFGAWTLSQPLYYRLQAGNINFIPNPTGGFSVNLNYTPTPPILVNGSDTFDGVNGWDDYVVSEASIRCALKDENFDLIQILEGRKAAVRQRIESMATERDAGSPERVQDVTGYEDLW